MQLFMSNYAMRNNVNIVKVFMNIHDIVFITFAQLINN